VGYGLPGAGIPGAAATSTATQPPRIWDGDLYGTYWIGTPGGQTGLYEWTGSTATAPTLVSGAPTAINGAFVIANIIMTYGAGGVGNKRQWCDQGNRTQWTSASTNQAGDDTDEGAMTYIGHAVVGSNEALLFTDSQVWHRCRQLPVEDGIAGKRAVAVMNGVVYWMGRKGFWRWYGGRPEPIPGDAPNGYVYGRLFASQVEKCYAETYPDTDRPLVRFCYPSTAGSGEIDSFAEVDTSAFIWNIEDTYDRTAQTRGQAYDYPMSISSGGVLYQHEYGNSGAGYAETHWFAPNGNRTAFFETLYPDGTQDGTVDVTVYSRDEAFSTQTIAWGPHTIGPATPWVNVNAAGQQFKLRIEWEDANARMKLGDMEMEVGT
jgi:hypothetical protein